MGQNLVGLPKEAHIRLGMWILEIKDHRIQGNDFIWRWLCLVTREHHWKEVAKTLDENGVTFEAVIETCVVDFEKNHDILAWMMGTHLGAGLKWAESMEFSKSATGRAAADRIIEDIRQCDDWEDLFNRTNLNSEWNDYLRDIVIKDWRKDGELIRCLRVFDKQ